MTKPDHRHDRALIYIGDRDHAIEQAADCAAYCQRRGYVLDSVVVGAEHWDEVIDLAAVRHLVDVVVVASRADLPAGRAARLESVTQDVPVPAVRPATVRRTRRLR